MRTVYGGLSLLVKIMIVEYVIVLFIVHVKLISSCVTKSIYIRCLCHVMISMRWISCSTAAVSTSASL